MVCLSTVSVFATLVIGAIAKRCPAVEFTGMQSVGCAGTDKGKTKTLRLDKCENFRHHFYSYHVNEHHWKHRPEMHERKCYVHIYEAEGCSGKSMVSSWVKDIRGTCENSTFDDVTKHVQRARGGRSVKLICDDKKPQNKTQSSSKVKHGSTSAAIVQAASSSVPAPATSLVNVTIVTRIPMLVSTQTKFSTVASPALSDLSCTRCPANSSMTGSGSTKTITATSSPSIRRLSSHTATIKKTTTIIAAPTATVEGTTTVWVAPKSSSVKVHTESFTVVVTDGANAAEVKRSVDATSLLLARRAAVTEKPTLVVRAAPSATECYASIDGQWIVSTCALPAATSSRA